MNRRLISSAAAAATLLGLASCDGGGGNGAFVPPPPPVPLTRVTTPTTFTANCGGAEPGTVYPSAEVEPYAAVNPANPDNLIAVWQQDRWSNGGARGLRGAFSTDGGATWQVRQVPFSRCGGGTAGNGGDFARATDPWVTFAPDGTAYWMALSFSDDNGDNAMLVSRSTDGGDTWSDPVALIANGPGVFNDKNSITADPADSNYVYAAWDRISTTVNAGPAFFARTIDGGATWEEAREIYDPGLEAQTVGNVIAVLPDGALVYLFTEIQFGGGVPDSAHLRVIRSTDRGATWLPPVTVAELLAVGTRDPQTGQPVRDGAVLGQVAVAPDGEVAVVWQDSRFSGGVRDGIALSRSTDGGLTWSAPVGINGEPTVAAFTPTPRYTADGTLGVSYYDLRDDTESENTLLAGHWLAVSTDGASWSERRVTGPFDLARAPDALGLFLGDYQALLAIGDDFRPFFVQTGPQGGNRTDLYTVLLPSTTGAAAKSHRAAARALPLAPDTRARVRALLERSLPKRRHDPG